MKNKFILTMFMLLGVFMFTNLNAQNNNEIINFPDENFKKALLREGIHYPRKIDVNEDGEIDKGEARSVRYLNVSSSRIIDLKGIEHFTGLINLNCSKNSLKSIDISNNNLSYLNCSWNQLEALDLTNQVDLIVLKCYRNYRIKKLDVSKLTKLFELNCSFNRLESLDVSKNLGLTKLYCSFDGLKSLDVSENLKLKELDCSTNGITSIDVTRNVKLTKLDCRSNKIPDIDVSKNLEVTDLDVRYNELTNLDTSSNIKLTKLQFGNNKLTNIDISKNTNLTYLSCGYNELTSLDLSNNNQLRSLWCRRTKIKTLDVRNCKLTSLFADFNSELDFIYATGQKFTKNAYGLRFSLRDSKMKFICVDKEYVADVRKEVTEESDNPNCIVQTGCDYDPTDQTYVIKGKTTISNTNSTIPNLFYSIEKDGESTGVYANQLGNYYLSVLLGNYTVTTTLEEDYYTITPTSSQVSFPTDGAEATRNFIAKPKGNINDLEIAITCGRARPGFDVSYIITYRNKGTTTQSGTVSLEFEIEKQVYVSSTASVNTDTEGKLVWNFANLKPFESRDIKVTFKVNTPTDVDNPVNGGDVLTYKAEVLGGTDVKPEDNIAILKQTVVNSFDPNDKTCIEGDSIVPTMVGKYLHYMIRFENKGTANAEKIVVKDSIDTTKFNISSLVPLRGSHSFITKVKGNEVSFIFDKINLPFDDANNDGYVLFKIKTKSNLKKGDVIKNKAGIYFDFNKPIITNEATTVIAEKKKKELTFSDRFVMYPNPAKFYLRLEQKLVDMNIKDVRVYNQSGLQLGYYLGHYTKSMFVGHLWPGVYVIKVNTDKGVFTSSFIKKW